MGFFISIFGLEKVSPQPPVEAPAKNDWIVIHLPDEPATLNPVLATDSYTQELLPNIFDRLISFDPDTGSAEARLARAWKVSSDGLTFDFYLRPDAVFHDGAPVTAEDVKFSFDVIQDPKVDAAHLRSYFSGIKAVEVVSQYHVRVQMKQPYFRNLIILGLRAVMPKHIYGVKSFNTNPKNRAPIGSGPYEFVHWEAGNSIVLKRFDKFWGQNIFPWKHRFNFERMIFRIVKEDPVANLLIQKGELDVLEAPASFFSKAKVDSRILQKYKALQFHTPDGRGYNYIGWNLRKKLFAKKEVRRALAHSFPREEIAKKIYFGLREMALGPFPRQSLKLDPKIGPLRFDPVEAKKLLKMAGWKDSNNDGLLDNEGVNFQFDLLLPSGSEEAERMALLYQNVLRGLGIRMNLRELEWSTFSQLVHDRKFDAIMMSWGSSQDLDPYQMWHSSQSDNGGSNAVGFRNMRSDYLLEQARKTLDSNRRRQMYREFSRIISDEAPYLFLFEKPQLYLVSKRFEAVRPRGILGLDPMKWYTPKGQEKFKEPL